MFEWAVKVMIHKPFSENSDQAMMLIFVVQFDIFFLLHMQFIATVVVLLWIIRVAR